MAKKPDQPAPVTPSEAKHTGNETLEVAVGREVLLALGRPPKMVRVQVKCLWSAFYRVNVFVGEDVTDATIANSYFVHASSDGHLLQADPAITRQYGLVKAADAS